LIGGEVPEFHREPATDAADPRTKLMKWWRAKDWT
jgi:hypothetical protein